MLNFIFCFNKKGTRYGASLRKQIKKMEVSQHAKYFCEFCGKVPDFFNHLYFSTKLCKGGFFWLNIRTKEVKKYTHMLYCKYKCSCLLFWINTEKSCLNAFLLFLVTVLSACQFIYIYVYIFLIHTVCCQEKGSRNMGMQGLRQNQGRWCLYLEVCFLFLCSTLFIDIKFTTCSSYENLRLSFLVWPLHKISNSLV